MFGKSIDKIELTFYYIKCEIQKKEKAEHHSAGTLARLPLITLFIELFMNVLEYAHSYNTYKLTECQLNSSNSA